MGPPSCSYLSSGQNFVVKDQKRGTIREALIVGTELLKLVWLSDIRHPLRTGLQQTGKQKGPNECGVSGQFVALSRLCSRGVERYSMMKHSATKA